MNLNSGGFFCSFSILAESIGVVLSENCIKNTLIYRQHKCSELGAKYGDGLMEGLRHCCILWLFFFSVLKRCRLSLSSICKPKKFVAFLLVAYFAWLIWEPFWMMFSNSVAALFVILCADSSWPFHQLKINESMILVHVRAKALNICFYFTTGPHPLAQ